MKENYILLNNLHVDDIDSITLEPYENYNSLIKRNITIKDTVTIRQVLNSYKSMRREKSGDGKLPGEWQIQLTFRVKGTAPIETFIHHNNYSNLIFIRTKAKLEGLNLEDYFANYEISKIILEEIDSD